MVSSVVLAMIRSAIYLMISLLIYLPAFSRIEKRVGRTNRPEVSAHFQPPFCHTSGEILPKMKGILLPMPMHSFRFDIWIGR